MSGDLLAMVRREVGAVEGEAVEDAEAERERADGEVGARRSAERALRAGRERPVVGRAVDAGRRAVAVLDDVAELVREQLVALGGPRGELAGREGDVLADGERARVQRLGLRPVVDAHAAEVVAEPRLHAAPHGGLERAAAAAAPRPAWASGRCSPWRRHDVMRRALRSR